MVSGSPSWSLLAVALKCTSAVVVGGHERCHVTTAPPATVRYVSVQLTGEWTHSVIAACVGSTLLIWCGSGSCYGVGASWACC